MYSHLRTHSNVTHAFLEMLLNVYNLTPNVNHQEKTHSNTFLKVEPRPKKQFVSQRILIFQTRHKNRLTSLLKLFLKDQQKVGKKERSSYIAILWGFGLSFFLIVYPFSEHKWGNSSITQCTFPRRKELANVCNFNPYFQEHCYILGTARLQLNLCFNMSQSDHCRLMMKRKVEKHVFPAQKPTQVLH